MQGEEQATAKAMARNKCKTKEEQKKKQKKHILTRPKSLLGFIFLSFSGLPWWRCCPK